jgi:hypothetical protein
MIKRTSRVKYFIAGLAFVLILLSATNFVFGQCGGTYFKLNYRAVNKTRTINNENFKLDDWNGDGKSDFWNFKLSPNALTKDILIYPSKPSGYWDWEHPILLTSSITTINSPIVVKDFNSDGKTDFFNGNRIYLNVNNETLTPLQPISMTFDSFAPFYLVDVTGDGLLDWVNTTLPSGHSSVGYFPGTADGRFGERVVIIAEESASTTVTGDFNGDGKTDIVFSNPQGYRVLLNTGGGGFSVGALTNHAHGHWHSFSKVGDFNGDGRADILGHGSWESIIYISYGQANGTFTEQAFPDISPVNTNYRIAELNGDNRPDFIVVYYNSYSTYLNNGAGGFARTDNPFKIETIGSKLLFEDFSGDGKADLHESNASIDAGFFNTFGEQVITVKENVCQRFGDTKRANFEGDYEGDLVFWNANTGDWASMNHSFSFNTPQIHSIFGSAADVPAPGDYDGDYKTDYAVFNTVTGDWKLKRSAEGTVTVHFGLGGDIAVPNDYDGGGKTDIAVFRPSDGNWYIYSSETQQVVILHFGLNGDKPVPADYDGDGKTDVAVYRPSEGNWYYYRSSDQSIAILHWGIDTDKPLPADYDGDGKADLAVWRGGDWYILRSDSYSFNFIHWGLSTDIPVPMYRDGNSGAADLVIYRPSNGYWYNYRAPGLPTQFSQTAGYVPVYFGLPNN